MHCTKFWTRSLLHALCDLLFSWLQVNHRRPPFGHQAFSHSCAAVCNSLPLELTSNFDSLKLSTFKCQLKTHLFEKHFNLNPQCSVIGRCIYGIRPIRHMTLLKLCIIPMTITITIIPLLLLLALSSSMLTQLAVLAQCRKQSIFRSGWSQADNNFCFFYVCLCVCENWKVTDNIEVLTFWENAA